ncbi:MAG: DUF3175 domain-containing protein [Alphaproteobacteria bacterium]|nr:DUF3175 domain-containing protein [Alphaproteobacteria bacterium]
MAQKSHGGSAGHALDLKKGLFTWKDPKRIAASLKRSAEESDHRKTDPYRSAISMLTFYVNRAGSKLSAERVRTLKAAKAELRRQFGREPPPPRHSHVARKRRPDGGLAH